MASPLLLALTCQRSDPLPDEGTSGEGDDLNIRMRDQGFAGFVAEAANEIEDSGGKSNLVEDLAEHPSGHRRHL